jgi:hypothetical protein
MMEPRTALKLLFAALIVLLVLHLIARSVNRSRAKASAPAPSKGKAEATPVGKVATSAPAAAIPVASKKVAAVPPKKTQVTSKSGPKRAIRAKAPTTKPKRRRKRPDVVAEQRPPRPAFLPVTKAKPAVNRRPKRATHIRRRKTMPAIALMRAGKVMLADQPGAP